MIDDRYDNIISYHTETEEEALTARTTFLMSPKKKRDFLERLMREGLEMGQTLRSLVNGYMETPERAREPVKVTLVHSHPLLTPKISGRTVVLLDSVERAKKLLNTIGIVTRELKREIRNETKKMAVSPELAADIEALLKAPEAKK